MRVCSFPLVAATIILPLLLLFLIHPLSSQQRVVVVDAQSLGGASYSSTTSRGAASLWQPPYTCRYLPSPPSHGQSPTALPSLTSSTAQQVFNPVSMRCEPCPTEVDGSVPGGWGGESGDEWWRGDFLSSSSSFSTECVCPPGRVDGRLVSGKGGGCERCPQGMRASPDGLECVRCGEGNGDSGEEDTEQNISVALKKSGIRESSCNLEEDACSAEDGNFTSTGSSSTDENPLTPRPTITTTLSKRLMCMPCPNNSLPSPAEEGGSSTTCQPCTDTNCYCRFHPSASECSGRNNNNNKQQPPSSYPENFPTLPIAPEDLLLHASIPSVAAAAAFPLAYIHRYLGIAEAECRAGSRRQCQHLANMCVLQHYAMAAPTHAQSACYALESIRRSSSSGSGGGGGGQTYVILPQLFYSPTEASMELYRESAIDATFHVLGSDEEDNSGGDGGAKLLWNTRLDVVSAVFWMNGSFVGVFNLSEWAAINLFSPGANDINFDPFRFGTFYHREWLVGAEWLAAALGGVERGLLGGARGGANPTTLFHELYLRYVDHAQPQQRWLYPIAIVNENIRAEESIESNSGGAFTSRYYLNRFATGEGGGGGAARGREAMFRRVLTRRLFLADRQLGIMKGAETTLLRFPTHISLHVNLQPTSSSIGIGGGGGSRIYPPYLRIRYADHLLSLPNTNFTKPPPHTLSFSIHYSTTELSHHHHHAQHESTMALLRVVLCSGAVLLAALRAFSWSRRAGKLVVVDAVVAVKFLIYAGEHVANVFLVLESLTAVWLTFAYRLQRHVLWLPVGGEQELAAGFVTYVAVAAALKALALLHTYVELALVETFFIDWERPRMVAGGGAGGLTTTAASHNDNRAAKAEASGLEDSFGTTLPLPGNSPKGTSPIPTQEHYRQPTLLTNAATHVEPPVIWRTYLVANEWNELQLYRKTHLAVQLLLSLLLLDYFHYADWAKLAPVGLSVPIAEGVAETRMSRYAADLVVYVGVVLAQWLLQVLLVERISDPFHNFVDLCSMANISVLSMVQPLRGFYLHGRSVHGTADTNMREMNAQLQRERDNLCALRGLEPGSELQTYVVVMPRTFRDRLDTLQLIQNGGDNGGVMGQSQQTASRVPHFGGGGDGRMAYMAAQQPTSISATANKATLKIDAVAQSHAEVNQFLKDVIDHVEQGCDYVITDTRLVEEVVGMELSDTSRLGTFQRDPSEMAYSAAFLYGNEWVLASFECVLFCLADMCTHSRLLSAVLTYAVSGTLRQIARLFFTNHLAKCSMVDARFLV